MNVVISVIVMCLLLLTAAPASAEWYGDVYAGRSLTLSDDVTVHSPSGLSIYRDTELDQSWIIGGRFGRYLDRVPFLGFGVDLFAFSPTIGPQQLHIDGCVPSGGCSGGQGGTTGRIDVEAIALSLDLMLRLPLLKSETAQGRARVGRRRCEAVEVGDTVQQAHPPRRRPVDDGQRGVVPALGRRFAIAEDEMPGGERSTHEAVRHHRQAAARGRRDLLHPGP